jgi:MFS family permease
LKSSGIKASPGIILDRKCITSALVICKSTYREAGCNPMSTGILSDIFSEDKRGLVMSIFNWGIYGGYGIAFPVGRYVPLMNTWDLVSAGVSSPLHKLIVATSQENLKPWKPGLYLNYVL